MAKDNAQKCRDYRAKKAQRKEALGERVVSLPLPASTCSALGDLMAWHGFDDRREVISTMIHRLHEAGPEGSAEFMKVSKHQIVLSEKVLRQLQEVGHERSEST